MHYFFIHIYFLFIVRYWKELDDKILCWTRMSGKIVYVKDARLKIGKGLIFFLTQLLCTKPSPTNVLCSVLLISPFFPIKGPSICLIIYLVSLFPPTKYHKLLLNSKSSLLSSAYKLTWTFCYTLAHLKCVCTSSITVSKVHVEITSPKKEMKMQEMC